MPERLRSAGGDPRRTICTRAAAAPLHRVVLALAARIDPANANRFQRPSAYHRIIDRATSDAWCFALGFEQEETEVTE